MQKNTSAKPAQEPGSKPWATKSNFLWETVFAAALSAIVFVAVRQLDLFEWFYNFSREHEEWELDELAALGLFLMFYFMVLAFRKWRQAEKAKHRLEALNCELEQAVKKIRTLEGIIPICARCKNIRDDKGYWRQVEDYIRTRTDARFSHGLCPECFAILYPDLAAAQQEKLRQAAEGENLLHN